MTGSWPSIAATRSRSLSVLSGTGALAQIGTGTTILTAANTYQGGTTIAAGTLQVGTGGTSGQLGGGGIVNNGVLAINRSDEITLSNDISGTGTLAQIGEGTTILTGNNTSSGPTIIASGVLQVGNGGTTGGLGTGDVLNQTALVFNRSGSLTVPGAISGAGTITQVGTGTTIFTGANTYSGVTTISAGTLQIGDGGTSGQLGTGLVINNGSLVFNRRDAIAVSNPISGTGSLTQAGIGVLTLSGAKTYTGNTFVNDGTLVLDGSLAGSTIVAPAALLAGAGLIGGTLTVNGTVMVGQLDTAGSPNGGGAAFALRRQAGLSQPFRAIAASAQASLGSLSVAGDVTFTAGSRNVVTLDATGGHTLLTTDGSAAIGGSTVVVAPQPGSYGRVTTYPVLYATGGLTGRAIVGTTNAELWPWANSTPDTLLVTVLNPAVPLQPLATTTNGAAFGAASDRLRPGATGDFLAVSRELMALDDVSLTGTLDALAGEIHSSSVQLAALDGEAATDMVRAELATRGTVETGLRASQRWTWSGGHLWTRVQTGRTAFDADVTHGGESNLFGLAAGVDWSLGDRWLAGGGGGYATGSLTLDGLSASSDYAAPRGFGYVGYVRDRWAARGGVSVARAGYRGNGRSSSSRAFRRYSAEGRSSAASAGTRPVRPRGWQPRSGVIGTHLSTSLNGQCSRWLHSAMRTILFRRGARVERTRCRSRHRPRRSTRCKRVRVCT